MLFASFVFQHAKKKKKKPEEAESGRGMYLFQSPRGEGGRKDAADPPPLIILCNCHSIVQRPIQTEIL